MTTVKTRKKLIEVALPLDAINFAAAREKSIRHGHPSTLHLYWARRPLAAARAVIFAQMVDDPSANPEIFRTEKDQNKERERLFKLIEDLVKWENTTNETVIQSAREEIWASWRRACADNADHPRAKEIFDRNKLPAFHDPFSGGGALPLEAQRLGLRSYATDLNPVSVILNKATLELPSNLGGLSPVAAQLSPALIDSTGCDGLAEDIVYYGNWMIGQAFQELGSYYPKVKVTKDDIMGRDELSGLEGQELTVIAWLWTRTARSPNPACAHIEVPLASTFMLSRKEKKEVYVEPIIGSEGYTFVVKSGKPTPYEFYLNGTKLARGANFQCLISKTPISPQYIKSEGCNGRLGSKLMAIVAEGPNGRVYLSPRDEDERLAKSIGVTWRPDLELAHDPRALWTPAYGLTRFADLFTNRQLAILAKLTGMIPELCEKVRHDFKKSRNHLIKPELAESYSNAIAVYLACSIDKATDFWSTLVTWMNDRGALQQTFGRQAIPMIWDYAEANPFSSSGGNFMHFVERAADVVRFSPRGEKGIAGQADACTQDVSKDKVVSTDPPYYDNIGYANLSDYFYVWLSRSVKTIYPDLFSTISVPKDDELVATPYRHGDKERAESFFLRGMGRAMKRLADQTHPGYPVTIYYAFKQSESDEGGDINTGWDTFLGAVLEAGFTLTGTWPIRTEGAGRANARGSNALASSIVLVCRKRPLDAPQATRAEFIQRLKREMPLAITGLQRGNIAPVDLAQAAIGPGMSIFSEYSGVIGAAGGRLSVREALQLINQSLDEQMAQQEGNWDHDTRWAVIWFEQNAFESQDFGSADALSKAKNTSVAGLVAAGIIVNTAGKVRLLKIEELPAEWDPETDERLTVWEIVHHMIRLLKIGEINAASIISKLGDKALAAHELAYRLYRLCESKKRPELASAYNNLIQVWPDLVVLSGRQSSGGINQTEFKQDI